MKESPLRVLAVLGTLQRDSASLTVISHVARNLEAADCIVEVVDFRKEPLALYDPDISHDLPGYAKLQNKVNDADIIVLVTPDYHGSISSAMKNFLDHFWHEFAGKLFVTIVASHEKGLTATDQLRTVARQCYAWTLPYGISFTTGVDVKDGQIASEVFRERLRMTIRDVCVYGRLLAQQRRADLAGCEAGFLAHYRKESQAAVS
jgi:NAD(P)H-dependent FMN reductase